MLTYTQAILLGLLQGVAELFPISSLGHTALIPALLGWNIDLSAGQFLPFIVATHLATALVLFFFFWTDWMLIIKGVLKSIGKFGFTPEDTHARLGWLIIVSTIPAGILGVLFEKKFEALFASPILIATMLAVNGLVLLGAEYLRKRAEEGTASDAKIAKLSWLAAFGIGCAQALALIPGFSRTGLAMTASLKSGLSHENAARYAFLLATPVIAGAAVLELRKLSFANGTLGVALAGAAAAALAAYLSVRFLMKYFETKTLKPFAIYCIIAGAISLIILAV